MTNKINIIEQRDIELEYGYIGTESIIDHPHFGRLLIRDGFGGLNSIGGSSYGYHYGMATHLKPVDTFETLSEQWNDSTSIINAATRGYDNERPILCLSGFTVDRIATEAGLK